MLQHRPAAWSPRSTAVVSLFGGHVEAGETPLEGVVRELKEELGAKVEPDSVVFLGAVTEGEFDHQDIVHLYYWRDAQNTITGCYEAERLEVAASADILEDPRLMPYAAWALQECRRRGLMD